MNGYGAETDADAGDRLILSFESWEGPLDLLLTLARAQKIDLAAIPIVPLVEQYLDFISSARALKLEIAADYLVMAAWLAYLKSALLLPREEQPDPDPEEMATRLRWRLRRLEAMRESADRLFRRDLLGRDVLRRGAPEGLRTLKHAVFDCELYDLMAAYGDVVSRRRKSCWSPPDRGPVMTLEEALERLSAMLGETLEWTELRHFLPRATDLRLMRSALASSFVAALELVRTGRAELAQDTPFAPLRLRRRAQPE